MPSGKNLLEVVAALATLAVVGFLLVRSGIVEPVFWVTAGATVAFITSCYLFPRQMTRLVSMPSAFRIDRNLGIESLEMQSVTYASYHTSWFSNTTHAGFVVDGVAWYVLVWHFAGWVGVAALLAWQVYQASTYRERLFMVGLVGIWIVIAALAYLAIEWLGEGRAVEASMYALVAMGLWRFIGHIAEPIPPDIAGNERFARLKDVEVGPRILVTMVLGYVAEFAAGLPFRLLNFWVYSVLIRLPGFQPEITIDSAQIEEQRDSIHRRGWAGGRSTAHLADQDTR